MKKNIIGIVLGVILVSLINVIPVHAEVINWEGITVKVDNGDSIVLPEGEKHSRDVEYSKFKGSIISIASADISNEGGGDIGIVLETLAHVPCDKIRQVAYLELKDDITGEWSQVAAYEFQETKDEHPTGELTGLLSEFEVLGCPSGEYRIRGIHGVWKDGNGEALSTKTAGVIITK